jgi:uncharacterized RDD family membrane protein YckC
MESGMAIAAVATKDRELFCWCNRLFRPNNAFYLQWTVSSVRIPMIYEVFDEDPLGILAPPIACDPLPLNKTLPLDRAIGALWRRVVAFAIDGIIVGLVGFAITLPFFEAFSRLGSWGPAVGFCLAFPYFAILNSVIGNGQTLGKRLTHLQVINRNGNTISFWRSAVRYAVFAVPYFLNEMTLPATRTPWVVSTLVAVVVIGVGGSTLYLVFFNRHTRQGVHDLAVGSYVTEADNDGSLKIEPIWGVHWVILGLLLIALCLGTGVLSNKLAQWGPFPQLLEDVRLVEGMEGVQAAGVQDMNTSNTGSGEKKKILVINVYWAGKQAFADGWKEGFSEKWGDKQAFADQVAKLIIEHDPTVKEHDQLKITVIRGYSLGIAHAQVSYYYQHTPAEWNARLFVAEQPPPSKP